MLHNWWVKESPAHLKAFLRLLNLALKSFAYDPLGAVQKHISRMTEQVVSQATMPASDKKKKPKIVRYLRWPCIAVA